jgi:hypothetical protein
VAARIRKHLGVEVKLVPGDYGEYTVLVDGEEVARAGRFGVLGVVPPPAQVIRDVAARLRR